MNETIKSAFTDKEWKVLEEETKDICEMIEKLPLYFEPDKERMEMKNG